MITKITTMSNGFKTASVGDFNIEPKVVAAFLPYVPIGARERANKSVAKKRGSPFDDETVISAKHVVVADLTEEEIPDDSQIM
jgi:hypothetical protein